MLPLPVSARCCRRLALVAALLALAMPAAAQRAEGCADTLRRAEDAYQGSRFAEAIQRVTPCLTGGSVEETIRAHRLLSMAHMNSGDAQGARLAIIDLLRLVPDYEPDPIQDPPSYAVLVHVIREQMRTAAAQSPEPAPRASWMKKAGTWMGLGGGLLVVGLTAILAADGGK